MSCNWVKVRWIAHSLYSWCILSWTSLYLSCLHARTSQAFKYILYRQCHLVYEDITSESTPMMLMRPGSSPNTSKHHVICIIKPFTPRSMSFKEYDKFASHKFFWRLWCQAYLSRPIMVLCLATHPLATSCQQLWHALPSAALILWPDMPNLGQPQDTSAFNNTCSRYHHPHRQRTKPHSIPPLLSFIVPSVRSERPPGV